MSAPFDPEWGDDLMAVADAVGASVRPHPELAARFVPHPSHAAEFTNLALELTVTDWSAEVLADVPIALVPTQHEACGRCDVAICRCDDLCTGVAEDACGHLSRPACEDCAPWVCSDCAAARKRGDR